MLFRGKDWRSGSRKRVGINAHLLSPAASYRRTGIHHYIAQVLRHLPLTNRSADYIVYTRDMNVVGNCEGLEVISSIWPTERRLLRILWEQSAWPLQAVKEKLDLLHSMAFVTPILGQIPTIVTVYDLSFIHFPEKFPRLQRKYLESQTGRSVDHARRVITISDASRQDIHRLFSVPLEQIDVVFPGVEPHFRPISAEEVSAFREKRGLPKNFILHVGTLQPRKNLAVLLDAMARLKRPDIELVLVGAKGWFYEEIFNKVERSGLSSRTHFAGYVPDKDLPFWYNSAKLLVFPSVYEGFGMPIIEAMACGTPVIAARTSSVPEAGGSAALYFDSQNGEALAQHLSTILNDKQTVEEMRARGFVQAQQFSWHRAGLETSQAYARVLAEQ